MIQTVPSLLCFGKFGETKIAFFKYSLIMSNLVNLQDQDLIFR